MLNESQKKIIKEIDKPLMVISSAGSGKSTSITNKITKLIMEGKSNIIAITFTKNTRIDLQRKIFKLKIKDDRGRLIDIKQRVKVETFHSLCRRLMLTEGLKADNLVIPYEVENVIKKIKPKDDLDLKDILGFIGYQKNYMRSCEDEFVEKDSNYFIDELRDFYRAYNNYQKENERYDFDDYLLEGYKILQITKDKYTCDYLLLDEAQDCNEVQMKIVDLLCPSHRVTVLGDHQQCIYNFRGSNPELFMNLYQRYENAEVINMNINYRSDKEIVERSNYFIKQYYGSYEYYMDAVANSTENGNIEFIKNSTDTDEALEVADKIQTLLGLGNKGKDIAILYRNNIQSQALEGELRKRGIHYYIDSDASFFNRKEIDMIMCILRLIKDNNDNSAYEKIFKYKCLPLNMLKNDLLSSISAISKNENKNFLESSIEIRTDSWRKNKLRNFHSYIKRLSAKYISGVTLDVLLNDIITLFSLEEYIKGQHSNDEDKVEKIKSIENLKKIAKGQTLEQLLKLAYEGGSVKKIPSDEDIRLMTMHKSKGLEFKNVIIIGVEQGKFPSEKSEEKEEARLFYVAITRAKNNMIISQIGEYNKFIEQYFGKINYAKRLEECV